MSEIFIISDTHFGHKDIIKFSETSPFRPFETIEEHDEELVDRWNKVVTKQDVVWHLGDVAFGQRNLKILDRLKGTKKLILGNHDTYGIHNYLQYFSKVYGCAQYESMLFTHIPVNTNQFPRFILNVHGHLHTKWVLREDGFRDVRYFNASCENTNLAPMPIEEVYNYWAENN